jgi:uncharacterized protein YjeT (DUF2065 family)
MTKILSLFLAVALVFTVGSAFAQTAPTSEEQVAEAIAHLSEAQLQIDQALTILGPLAVPPTYDHHCSAVDVYDHHCSAVDVYDHHCSAVDVYDHHCSAARNGLHPAPADRQKRHP